MDVPTHVAGGRVLAVAAAEQPEALAATVLDDEVVAHGSGLAIVPPPFAKDALGTVGPLDPPAHPAPGEPRRRMVRQQRDSLDRFGERQQPARPRPVLGPYRAGWRGERRHAPDRALGHVALDRHDPIEPACTEAVREPIDQSR